MRLMTSDEVLKLQVEILAKVDAFCREHSISYTVDGGTCIGAVRHKGYIPWDDDIDIAMTRPNYDRFIHLFNGHYPDLEVLAPELNWNYYAPYGNVYDKRTILNEGANGHHGMDIGVKIDVFPIDGVASDIKLYHKNKVQLKLLWYLLYIKRYQIKTLWPHNKRAFVSKAILKFLSSPIKYSNVQKRIHALATSYLFNQSEYVEDFVMPWPHDVRCSQEAFKEYTTIDFENIKVSIIKGFDEYLTKLYGNYMELPPIEKRVNHHNFIAYWKDDSSCLD